MAEHFNELGLLGLFLASFFASTIVPVSSELVLFFLLYKGISPLACLSTATVGNMLGGISSYYLGYLANIKLIKKYTGVSENKLKKWYGFTQKKGKYLAFFSWLPFIGDVFIILLGMLKSPKLITFIFMFIGKFIRYIVLLYFANFILF